MVLDEKTRTPSYLDHPGKVAVVATVVGSIILVVGQLFGTFFPIWFGSDLSDYNLVCDPIYTSILIDEQNVVFINNKPIIVGHLGSVGGLESVVNAINLHRIHKYLHEIYLSVDCPPGFDISISNPIIIPGKPVNLRLGVNLTYVLKYGNRPLARTHEREMYPIVIQGIGADGKKRNCTMIIEIGAINRSNSMVGGPTPLRYLLRHRFLGEPIPFMTNPSEI